MSTKMKIACALGALVVVSLAAGSASAQCFRGPYCGRLDSYFGLYSNWCLEQPPYFACNPPVYYQMRWASVHYSPRSTAYRPAPAPAAPLVIANPFVVPQTAGDTAGGPSAVKPLRINNVYVATKS